MRLVSWNVNGIRSCLREGLRAYMEQEGADVYCLQETKANEPVPEAVPPGYETYWSFCASRRGYSGTVVITKHHPAHVWRAFPGNEIDCEGRLLVLDMGTFFLVNCYVPNPMRSEQRRDYRARWDEQLLEHLRGLRMRKPVVVCGDFNVTTSDGEVYAENQWVAKHAQGFQSQEREGILAIIGSGYVDTYRLRHPDEKGRYTWWSLRRCKRSENRGWRLDYFLVSDGIADAVTESNMRTEVMGSDHCPIVLDIDVEVGKAPSRQPGEKRRVAYHDLDGLSGRRVVDAARGCDLAALWESVDWDAAEQRLADMQRQLAIAARRDSPESIECWQKRIVYSLDAKLLAVRHVCANAGGCGVDGIQWVEPEDKAAAALSLTSKDYQALPAKLLLVRSRSGKQRRIQVETYYDRAMQALYAFSLDPVAESWGDRKSFAYRKGRSAFDMDAYIRRAFSGRGAPEWAFVADVRRCYEHMSHDWVMHNVPMARKVLWQFLRAGYVFAGELFPATVGIGIGCTLSPIIANMALDGLQDHIYDQLYPGRLAVDYDNGNMVRYADDIVVAARSRDDAVRIRGYMEDFLAERGLELSREKCRIVNVAEEGLTFMSRTYRRRDGVLYAEPSEEAVQRFMDSVREVIEGHTGSQRSLIERLNRKIDGWTSYHKVGEADMAFRHVDVYIEALLLKASEERHPKWGREKVLERYFFEDAHGRHCYALPDKREVHVKFLADVPLATYVPVKTNVNPYLDGEYLEWRTHQRGILNASGAYRPIWDRQEGRCYYCGQRILRDEEKALVEVEPGRRRFAARMAYVHERCRDLTVDAVEADVAPTSVTDVMALLRELQEGRQEREEPPYEPLSEYFRTCEKNTVTLTFAQVEKVLGRELGEGANAKEFWYGTGPDAISRCWLDNGYSIRRLHLGEDRKARRVVFALSDGGKGTSGLVVPAVLRHGRIPSEAKYELENHFQYVIRKYAL